MFGPKLAPKMAVNQVKSAYQPSGRGLDPKFIRIGLRHSAWSQFSSGRGDQAFRSNFENFYPDSHQAFGQNLQIFLRIRLRDT
jgi:hypothetical protein